MSLPDRTQVRDQFPAIAAHAPFAFLENAGGSQVPGCVIDAIRGYLQDSYVQLGAGYPLADRADAVMAQARAFIHTFMGAEEAGKVILGPSTTALTHVLANAYAEVLQAGDEVVIAINNHEANAGPWTKLERVGAKIVWWPIHPGTLRCELEDLASVLTSRTRIVALPHVSNLLGQVADLAEIVRLSHAVGARVVADGVAYAPHHPMSVAEWGVDWYVYSTYKVYGPHMAAMFGTHQAFAEIQGPGHFFFPSEATAYKFELGSLSHEGCAGLVALGTYLQFLSGRSVTDRQTIVEAMARMEELESPLTAALVAGLRQNPKVKLLLPEDAKPVGTVSFLHTEFTSQEVARRVIAEGCGIRHGHMYAYRLCQALGIDPADGVVRISLLHYNTMEEVERVLAAIPS